MASAYVLERSLLEECGDRPDCDSAVAIMTKKGSKKKPRYEGTFTEELLVAWAQSHAAPLVARYSE